MKIRILSSAMVLSCSVMAGGAFAAGPYIGANYNQIQYDNDDVDDDRHRRRQTTTDDDDR